MDELARFNKERWEALAQADVAFARPLLDLDLAAARRKVDGAGLLGDLRGKDVLCLASGGGQQSIALALLGARVTVFDLTETQLARDRQAAAHYKLSIAVRQGDMRDLSAFADASFDVVYQAYSINFVPDPRPVFREAARVIRPGGLYLVQCHNPFTQGVDEASWDGVGYRLVLPYGGGELDPAIFAEPDWVFENAEGVIQRVPGPREFRHPLSTMLNGLAENGFVLLHTYEETSEEPDPLPGSWEHYKLVTAWIIGFWTRFQPELRSSSSPGRAMLPGS